MCGQSLTEREEDYNGTLKKCLSPGKEIVYTKFASTKSVSSEITIYFVSQIGQDKKVKSSLKLTVGYVQSDQMWWVFTILAKRKKF